MMDMKNIIGLQFSETEQTDINFENIIITTDADLPGAFIAGQLIGMLRRFGQNLFEDGRVKRLMTPIMIVTDNKEKIVTWFYTFDEYKKFEAKNKDKKYNYDYKKGLGSFDQDEMEAVINKDGLDNMLVPFEWDETASQKIDDWLGGDSQPRKDALDNFEFNIMSV